MQEISCDRRRFIKAFTLATAYSTLGSKAWVDILAAEVRPLATGNTGTLRLRLAEFPALQQPSGSVRLGVNPLRGSPPNGPTPNGAFYPVIINRGEENNFFAVSSRCTHQSCVVDALDPSDNRMTCPCHGSVYGIDGRRISGPAPTGLTRYTTSLEGTDVLLVQIPNLGFAVTASNPQAGSTSQRLQLTFSAQRNVEYEVRFRESWDAEASPVNLALTPDGALDQATFTSATNATASVYVDRKSATGFFVVVARANEV